MKTTELLANKTYNTLKFAGHETFAFRYGWLKKAVDSVKVDQKIFSKEEAIVDFGVGKNMVKSIKYWGLATQILIEDKAGLRVSEIGRKLLETWDPYLEDPASLWLIHWLLATNPSRAAVWYLSFNKYPRPDFTKNQILSFIMDVVNLNTMKVNSNTLNRDVDCFLRTYLPAKNENAHFEETFSCPLNELDLLNQLRDGESYQFNIGPKNTLPSEVAGYAILKFVSLAQNNRKTISVSDCLYKEGSPGQVFKIDENSLIEYIEELNELTEGAIELDDTAGLKQLYFKNEYEPISLLSMHYS